MNSVRFFRAPFCRIILTIILILSSTIVSTAAPKHFILPSWVTFLPEAEYLGVSRPGESVDMAIQSAILSYLICTGKIGNNPYHNTMSSKILDNGQSGSEVSFSILVTGTFKGQVHYNICRQEKLPNGEWVVSISDGQQYSEDIDFSYVARCNSWSKNENGRESDSFDYEVAVKLKTPKTVWTLDYCSTNGNQIGELKQSYADADGKSFSYTSSNPKDVLPIAQSGQSEASFNKLRKKFELERIHNLRDIEYVSNFGYNPQNNSVSDVYLSNILRLLGHMDRFRIEKNKIRVMESVKYEDKAFLAFVSDYSPMAGTVVNSYSENSLFNNIALCQSVGDSYIVNIPFHIDAFYMQDCYSGFVCSSVASQDEIRDALIYSSREIFKSSVKEPIEDKISKWAKKDEFETYAQWQERVTKARRDSLAKVIVADLAGRFVRDNQDRLNSMVKLSLGRYDADNQSFSISDKIWGDFYISVPICDAKKFKENWEKNNKEYSFGIDNGKFYLKQIQIIDKSGKIFLCDNSTEVNYQNVVRELNLGEIDYGTYSTHIKKRRPTNAVRKSDVDLDIPKADGDNKKCFAVIIANQQYQYEQDVLFAQNDGAIFKEYLVKTFGIPDENVHLVNDATLNNISREVNWISKVSQVFKGEASIIFYYAGHGISDENTKDTYLLPVDGYGTDPLTGFSLSRLFSNLGKNPTKQTLVLLDACFSGAVRGQGMLENARGVAVNVKEQKVGDNMIVFSAAQGDQTAWPYPEKSHGMFTYFLLKKIRDTRGEVTLGELTDYVIEQVSQNTIIHNSKSQIPALSTSIEKWEGLPILP